ncbi:MAG: uncharacterized protein K0S07_673 [Chlamydiales bacterium]|jgi:arabinose-5-phosphate isomerase|nr:uncharacterized protein [Chlamydiales bacterium]
MLLTSHEGLLGQLMNEMQGQLNYFFSQLDYQKLDQLLKELWHCKGNLFFTGVGKSGIVANKIATTLTSTGTKSLYLSPMDALHGDVGLVEKGDVALLFSKSGETDELLQLMPALKNKGARVIAVVCEEESRVARSSDLVIVLPLQKELCPFGLAPTTSTSLQLIFGDVLAVALMRVKNFSLDQYAKNHPAGRIGKRITLHVRDLMLSGRDLPLCHPQQSVLDILVELSDKKCGCVLVVSENLHLVGIFTDGDLRRALQLKGPAIFETKIEEVMSLSPKCTHPEALAVDGMKIMESGQPVTVLPVLDEGKLVGLLKMHDIIQIGL